MSDAEALLAAIDTALALIRQQREGAARRRLAEAEAAIRRTEYRGRAEQQRAVVQVLAKLRAKVKALEVVQKTMAARAGAAVVEEAIRLLEAEITSCVETKQRLKGA